MDAGCGLSVAEIAGVNPASLPAVVGVSGSGPTVSVGVLALGCGRGV
jgi:hypothetical protein